MNFPRIHPQTNTQSLNRRILAWASALALITLTSCSGGTNGGTETPTSNSAVIGAAGGTLNGPDGTQVVVPAGALDQPTTISISRSSVGAPATLPEDNQAGPIYEFLPHGLVFNKPVTIRMPVPANAPGNGAFMASPGENWQLNDATVTSGVAEWQRNSFSWGMIPFACAPANNPPYSASQPDPYPCTSPRGWASASATPTSAITQLAYNNPFNSAGSWAVNQTGTVRLTLNYQTAPDCQNPRAKLLRWDPTVPLSTPNRVTTLFDAPVALTTQAVTVTAGVAATATGTYSRGVGSTFFDVAFSQADNGISAFGYSFSCNRPSRPVQAGGDLLTFIAAIPVPSVTYTIGGAVSGLSGSGLVLQDNGGDNLALAANGSFTFANPVGASAPYSVTIQSQPSGQTCTVTNGSGTASSNVSNVALNCVTTYGIGGTVSGLVGTGLVLQNNGADNLPITASGAFTFATSVVAGGAYNVSVLTQPSGSTCSVQNGTGTANAAVTNASITCVSASTGPLALVANSGVTNGTNGLSVYRADATTGALSFLSNVNAGNTPYAVAISPNGLYAYVTNQQGGTVSSYSIDNAAGVVSPIPLSSPGSNNASGIAMDRLGRYIWVANYGFNTVSAFSIASSSPINRRAIRSLSTASIPPMAPSRCSKHSQMSFLRRMGLSLTPLAALLTSTTVLASAPLPSMPAPAC
jgi:hypothetical protein